MVIILALVGALILGIVALINVLATAGDNADSATPGEASCPELVDRDDATRLAESARTREMRITFCATPDSPAAYECAVEFEDDREPFVASAELGSGVYICGDTDDGAFGLHVFSDAVSVFENGRKTDQQERIE
jgi:hypothetical protein